VFNQFEVLKSFFLDLDKLFNNPQIRALEDEDFEGFKRIAPDVLARMEKSEIPAS